MKQPSPPFHRDVPLQRPQPVEPFNFLRDGDAAACVPSPLGLDAVPLWLRLPGEPGYVPGKG